MKRTLKDLDRFERIQLTFQSNISQMVKEGVSIKEKSNRITQDGLELSIVTRYYNHEDLQFASKKCRDYMQNFAFTAYEFMIKFKGKECFCKVLLGQHKRPDRIATTYEVSLLNNRKTRELRFASDYIELMSDDERNLLHKIEKCRELASAMDMLDKAQATHEEIE